MDDATASGDDRNGTGRDGKEKKADAVAAKKVSLLGMFRYADRLDVLLMVVGTVGAVANGMAEPLVTVLFGNVIDSFGESSAQSIARRVNKKERLERRLRLKKKLLREMGWQRGN